MDTHQEVVQEYRANYRQLTKHRARCRICGKLIQEHAAVLGQKIVSEKYYPVKGIMKYTKWVFIHEECRNHR